MLVTANTAVEELDSQSVFVDWHGARIFSPSKASTLIINVKIRRALMYDSNAVLSGHVRPCP
jgi:hypothetical protein